MKSGAKKSLFGEADAQSVEQRLWALCNRGDSVGIAALAASEEAKALTEEKRKFAFHSGLRHAAFINDLPCLKELIRHVGDCGRELGKPSALALAASQGHLECAEALLPVSNPNERGDNGETALHCALNYLHSDVATLLLPLTDLSIKDKHGDTPLMSAASMGSTAMTRALLPKSDPREVNEDGDSALALAAKHDHAKCVEILAAFSAVCMETGLDRPAAPFEIALRLQHWECVDALGDYLPEEELRRACFSAKQAIKEAGETELDLLPRCFALLERQEISQATQAGLLEANEEKPRQAKKPRSL